MSADDIAWSSAGVELPQHTWSPDGTKLAFKSDATTLTVVPIDGKERTYTVDSLASNVSIVWSADGQAIYIGHDHIDGGGGRDVIGAQDGERDWITCDTPARGSDTRERDVVYADKTDTVARDCEVVHRR